MNNTIVILHNIRSTHNVGSVFRTADGAGVKEVILSGYTPAPIDRFGRQVSAIAKTSLGACDFIPWRQTTNILTVINELQKSGVQVIAIEQDARAVNLMSYKPGMGPVAFIFGNEVTGVESEVLDAADVIIELPMLGQKESLNVSVTAGIVLYHQRLFGVA
jgi:23S rRNA (guanosine2251-2'-O)-methyltransferase